MTIEEAFAVLRLIDRESAEPFSAAEKAALVEAGTAWKMGTLTREQAAEFEALMGQGAKA